MLVSVPVSATMVRIVSIASVALNVTFHLLFLKKLESLNFCTIKSLVLIIGIFWSDLAQDLMAITSLNQVSWGAGEGWLINVFDWDTILVDENTPAELSFNLDLCTGIRPCFAHIKGSKFGMIRQSGGGYISCLGSHHCTGLVLESVWIACKDIRTSNSVLKSVGSTISVINSSFSDCSSQTDGGAIQAYDRSQVQIMFSTFRNLHSYGRGGAVGIHKSDLNMTGCNFYNTSSDKGGGGVWASFQETYGAQETAELSIRILNSQFRKCTSKSFGGAVFIPVVATEFKNMSLRVQVESSKFFQCASNSGGGALYASGSSVMVDVADSEFTECNTLNSGGAVAAVDCNMSILGSYFQKCTSNLGGGAISVTRQSCGESVESSNIKLSVQNSTVLNCSSYGPGGAVIASLNSSTQGNGISVLILKSRFLHCISSLEGGAFYANGASVSTSIQQSEFNRCLSSVGGAISVADLAQLATIDTKFESNSALGLGGGALHLKNAIFSHYKTSCNGNMALAGGGGVLLWQGYIYPYSAFTCPSGTTKSIDFCYLDTAPKQYNCSWLTCKEATATKVTLCGSNNTALYGPCIASESKQLLVSEITSMVFPGFQFSVYVSKKDAYNQTIVSDSITPLSLISVDSTDISGQGNSPAVLQNGIAVFPKTAIKPIFKNINLHKGITTLESQPYLYIVGTDMQIQTMIQSANKLVTFYQGRNVCPAGYILALEQGLSGPGVCAPCPSRTYSINPLANMENSSELAPACLNCPAGSVCYVLNRIVEIGKISSLFAITCLFMSRLRVL